LSEWCRSPTRGGAAQEEGRDDPEAAEREQIRAWIREELEALSLPLPPAMLLQFDDLAKKSGVSRERRIEVLRSALAVELARPEGDAPETSGDLLHRARAGLQMMALGGSDERLAPLLEEAVRVFADPSGGDFVTELFLFADAIMTWRPADASRRDLLVWSFLSSTWPPDLSGVLEILERAGLSVEERIDVLMARLGVGGPPEWLAWSAARMAHPRSPYRREMAPELFKMLEDLGCPPERRARALDEFVRAYAPMLSFAEKLSLSQRAEPPIAARLLLGALGQDEFRVREVVAQWNSRVACRRDPVSNEERWPSYMMTYLSIRLLLLMQLIQDDDPARMEALLASIAVESPDAFLAVYRQCSGALSDDAWARLVTWLGVAPDERVETQVSKECLVLKLWEVLEPSGTRAVLRR